MIGELLKVLAGLVAVEVRQWAKDRAERHVVQNAHIRGVPSTTVQCDRCGASVPAHDIAMAAHRRFCSRVQHTAVPRK